ncbi:MAG: hypothetical protein ACKVX7_07235 [Planctomycetota bacterium]
MRLARAVCIGFALLIVATTAQVEAQGFVFSLPDVTVEYEPADGVASFTISASVTELGSSAGFPNATLALSLGVRHDETYLLIDGVAPTGVLAALSGGTGPEFFAVNTYIDGFTVGCVYTFNMSTPISFPTAQPVLSLDYSTQAAALIGDLTGVDSSLDYDATLGAPAVANVVVIGLTERFATGDSGLVSLVPDLGLPFVRGDTNGNGNLNIADSVLVLLVLFEGVSASCVDALDCNDDGQVNLADAVYHLNFLFESGPAFPAPYPLCGIDPSGDTLDCGGAANCP